MKLELQDIGSQVLDFIDSAISHGLESLVVSKGSLVPFVIKSKNINQQQIERFLSDYSFDSYIEAENYASKVKNENEIVVIVYDGYLDIDKKTAIFAKVWFKGHILLFAQKYLLDNEFNLSVVDHALYIECKEDK